MFVAFVGFIMLFCGLVVGQEGFVVEIYVNCSGRAFDDLLTYKLNDMWSLWRRKPFKKSENNLHFILPIIILLIDMHNELI